MDMDPNNFKEMKKKKAIICTNCNTINGGGCFPTKEEVVVTCTNTCCFFCAMKERDPERRSSGIEEFFREMPHRDDQEHVLAMSGLWNIAMTQPDGPEFPSLGVFRCMALLIQRGLTDHDWLVRDQNIYIPYYAAHVIGSYTINVAGFAELAVESGVVPPLLELLRGGMSWVEQRVAVRALGHLASYDTTFHAVAEHEKEVVALAMAVASTCLEKVYVEFVGVADRNGKQMKYQCDLLTRGLGGVEMENRKAEEWASQLQCWSLYLLSCFACKERSHPLISKPDFLRDLSRMWGGLVNDDSPAGVGLMRILCRSEAGRAAMAESEEVIQSLCNLSRSSDDWQYMGIDCLLMLIKDQSTRHEVMEIAAASLVDLAELGSLGTRRKLGEAITDALLLEFDVNNSKKSHGVLQSLFELKVERKKREEETSKEEIRKRRAKAVVKKQQGNESFRSGDMEEAQKRYTEALEICPLRMRKERVVLYSNRAQCHLLLRDADAAISDATRALSLSRPANSHCKSLWRRSQAYDMKGLAKESLMDCIMFVNGCLASKEKKRGRRVPYYAARMIHKQMSATGLFTTLELGKKRCGSKGEHGELEAEEEDGLFDLGFRSVTIAEDEEACMLHQGENNKDKKT